MLVGWGLESVDEGGGEDTEDGVEDTTELVDGDDADDCTVVVAATGMHSTTSCQYKLSICKVRKGARENQLFRTVHAVPETQSVDPVKPSPFV